MNNIDAFKAHNKTFRLVGVAIVLVVAFAVGVVFAVNSVNRTTRPVGSTVGTANAASHSPNASPVSSPVSQAPASSSAAPSAAPAAPAAGLESFVCNSTSLSSSKAPQTAYINGVRTGAHSGYDRLVIQFGNGQPSNISLRPQSGTSFVNSPKGDTVVLSGKNGLLIVIRGADAHTSYNGALDFKAVGPSLREVRRIEDFEGQVQWALGVANNACYHTSILNNPTRLVIDVQVG
jgi:hypothetical protein